MYINTILIFYILHDIHFFLYTSFSVKRKIHKYKQIEREHSRKMEDDLKCSICLDIASDAVETMCCFQIHCPTCISNLEECPNCRANLETKPSMVVRRIIGRLPITCPNKKCNLQTTRADLDLHLMKCEFQTFECPSHDCEFSGVKRAFADHLAAAHTTILVLNHIQLFEDATTTSQTDRIQTVETDNGNARLGATGKYYCGGNLNGPCSCCDGACGTGNGCNCLGCMRLDVTARKLPRNWFVNREGFACRRGREGRHFFCGRKVMEGEYGCDGYCGPTDGPNCYACRKIDEQYNTRYAAVWL